MKIGLNGTGVLAVAGVAVAGLLLWKYRGVIGSAAGIVTGDNALTKNATNAAGQPVTAYQGVPVLGTLGAAANAVSGGYLSTFGEWLGGKVYDVTHPTAKDITAPVLIGSGQASTGDFARLDRSTYYTSGQSGSGSLVDRDIDFGSVNAMGDYTGW